MRIHSKNAELFIRNIRTQAREIMNNEMNIPFKRSRFLWKGYYYPLSFYVFEGRNLGEFRPSKWSIGLNKKLLYSQDTKFHKNVLRHELAHLYSHLIYGQNIDAHGKEFREICQKFGWGGEVSKASDSIELKNLEPSNSEHRVIGKIKKLLALAESCNESESKMAMAKANELLLKHQIENITQTNHDEEYCILESLKFMKRTAKYRAIADILETFYVFPIFNYTKDGIILEITGTRVNVEVANYVAGFLENELERLFKSSGLKGLKAKNSFMHGFSLGYIEKIKSTETNQSNGNALTIIKNELSLKVKEIYSGLRHQKSSYQEDSHALSLGKSAGKNLNINKGIKNKSRETRLLI